MEEVLSLQLLGDDLSLAAASGCVSNVSCASCTSCASWNSDGGPNCKPGSDLW